ncbi:acylphosphatase [Methylocystis sp. 9N]|uniref:acylphosphatase n=1 Tax=Methylocystis borbori TaxID=3118750 RepID=A0ABU7XKG5_9HYPH
MSERQIVRLIIEGRVQGVGYRAFLIREALALELAGWTRNRRDGSVEAVAVGSRAALDALIDAARRGPRLARVEIVREEPADEAALVQFRGAGFVLAPDA